MRSGVTHFLINVEIFHHRVVTVESYVEDLSGLKKLTQHNNLDIIIKPSNFFFYFFFGSVEINLGEFQDQNIVSIFLNRNLVTKRSIVPALCLIESLVLGRSSANTEALPEVTLRSHADRVGPVNVLL